MDVVGLVLVSHSRGLAVAVEALVRQMTGPAARIALAAGAGDDQADLGTDATAIVAAIEALDSDAGTLVLMDIGSALLSAELALDLLEPGVRSRVALCAAPFVEGALAAGVAASGGAPLARVRREAEQSLAAKQDQLGAVPLHDMRRGETDDRDGAAIDKPIDKLVPVTDPAGLHLRPAAAIARYAQGQPHMIRIGVAGTGRSADAGSLTGLLGLGAREGMALRITTSSAAAVDAIAGILA
ncbi:dihydroxyacetone kinase phosphoryl donor subunit DhaM, partial [Acidiphilium sp.]|uniref:dihydroxyacetone kinase phosphoryl donor subunit DhaM n=1 Tax=Acidiphilium sp. TaxID=527 RepID=UPI003CFC022C